MDVTIRELPLRYNIAFWAKMLLLSKTGDVLLTKFTKFSNAIELLEAEDIGTQAQKFPVLSHLMILNSDMPHVIAQKSVGIEETNKLILNNSDITASITRYRLLGEMDVSTETQENLTLAEFDDMILEDVDYVTFE